MLTCICLAKLPKATADDLILPRINILAEPGIEIGAENYFDIQDVISADFAGDYGILAESDCLHIFYQGKYSTTLSSLVDFPFPNFRPKKVAIYKNSAFVLFDAGVAPNNVLEIDLDSFNYTRTFHAEENIIDFELTENGIRILARYYAEVLYIYPTLEDLSVYSYVTATEIDYSIKSFVYEGNEFSRTNTDYVLSMQANRYFAIDNVQKKITRLKLVGGEFEKDSVMLSTHNSYTNSPTLLSTDIEYTAVYDSIGEYIYIYGKDSYKIENLPDVTAILLVGDKIVVAQNDRLTLLNLYGELIQSIQVKGSSFASLANNNKNEIFASDIANATILKFSPDLQTHSVFLSGKYASQLQISERNENLYILVNDAIEVYSGKTLNQRITVSAKRFMIDFENNLFLLNDDIISKYQDLDFQIVLAKNYKNAGFDDFCLDKSNGNVLLSSSQNSTVFCISSTVLGAKLFTDFPTDLVYENVLDKEFSTLEKVKVLGYPSTIFYQVKSYFMDDVRVYFIQNREFIKVRDCGEFILVFDSVNLCEGYILSNNVQTTTVEINQIQKRTMFETVAIFNLPSINEQVVNTQIAKGELVWVEYEFSIDDINFAYVEYGEIKGFIQSERLIIPTPVSLDKRTSAKVLGIKNQTMMYLHDSKDSEVVVVLADMSKVKINAKVGDFYYCEYRDGDVIYSGYIQSQYLIFNGFSNSQRLGVVIFLSMLVLLVLTILIRKKIVT